MVYGVQDEMNRLNDVELYDGSPRSSFCLECLENTLVNILGRTGTALTFGSYMSWKSLSNKQETFSEWMFAHFLV